MPTTRIFNTFYQQKKEEIGFFQEIEAREKTVTALLVVHVLIS